MHVWLALFLVSFVFIPSFASAGQEYQLRFGDVSTDVREQQVLNFLVSPQANQTLPRKIAKYDLNGDGVEEWVVREQTSPDCQTAANCAFYFVGLKKNDPVLLGAVTAGKINISDRDMYGVHNLAVYNNPNNDLEPVTFGWDPYQARYLPF